VKSRSNPRCSYLPCSHLLALTIMNGFVPSPAVPTSFLRENASGNGGGNGQKTALFTLLFPPLSPKQEKSENKVIGALFVKVFGGAQRWARAIKRRSNA
jgi:hypothetical protein